MHVFSNGKTFSEYLKNEGQCIVECDTFHTSLKVKDTLVGDKLSPISYSKAICENLEKIDLPCEKTEKMAAVPVNMMHGLPIPTPMQVMPCSSMLSIPISTMSYNTSNTLTSNDFSPQMQMQDSSTMVNPNHVGNPVASSPSRSLSSASPPASSMMNGSTMMASASSPLPEENPEYLKELQAEKDTLELSSSVNGSSSEIPTGENNENNENQNKTNHALKLLEQGKNSFYFLSKNH